MTTGTVRLTISTRRTEKGTRTESEIMSPVASAVGRAGNWRIGSNDIRIRNAILITQSLQCKCNWLHFLFNVEQYQNTY